MTLEHVTNHVEQALDRLTQQFKGKPNVETVVSALASPTQDIEDALWQLFSERDVETATGVQLDAIGNLVGQPRGGLIDGDYRRFVRARISVNKSNGLVEDILTVSQLVLADDVAALVLVPSYPAAILLRIVGSTVSEEVASLLVSFLRKVVAAGVRLVIQFQSSADPDAFYFAGGAIGKGFGDTGDLAVGGNFASATE